MVNGLQGMRTATKTYDEMAVSILLGPGSDRVRQAALTILAKKAQRELSNKVECPSCGDHGPHEDNGASRRSDLTYLCTSCYHQWDAEQG